MNYPNLKNHIEKGYRVIELHRPQAHNALNMELIREMRQALREMEGLRALVLTGEGKTFCAGGDLKWMEEMTKQDVPGRMKDAE